jgi:FixJ family two-component response regulator
MMGLDPMVFVVDEDASVRKSLGRLLRSVGLQVASFATAHEFLQRPPHDGPNCLVADVQMPGLDGLALQEALAATSNPIPIIFIAGYSDISTSVKAMKAGAVDFLSKPLNKQDLLDAIQQAIAKDVQARKERTSLQDVLQRVQLLTPREHEVLALVVRGLLNKQIAGALGTSEKTIKAHRASIMRKMRVQSLAHLVLLAERAGITPPPA